MTQGNNRFNFNLANIGKDKGGMDTSKRFSPANLAKFKAGFQKLQDKDGDGIADIFEGFMGEARQQLGGFGGPGAFLRGGARCLRGVRGALNRRPVIHLRLRANNIAIATTSGIVAQILDKTGDGTTTGFNNGGIALSGTNAARTLLSREADYNKFYSQVKGACVRYIKPVVKVWASRAGEPVDKDLSEQVRQLLLDNLVVVLDRDGKGKDLALAPVYFSHLPNRGITLDEKDQVFDFDDNSVLRFDYNGVGEQGGNDNSYRLLDLTPAAAFTVSVQIGFDIIISENPNDDVDMLIHEAQGIA
jgi:hypothetical protein